MYKLDKAFLEEVGLGPLPPHEANAMLAHVYETLEMRVGTALAREMSKRQLDEFEALVKNGDEPGAATWLDLNFPEHKTLVAAHFTALKAEIQAASADILAASGLAPGD